MIDKIKPSEMLKISHFTTKLIKLYGYRFQVPSRKIAKEIGGINYVTVRKYLALLEKCGFASYEMKSRYHGKAYVLNQRR